MGTLGILIAVAVLIGLFSYFTNAGFGDRKPPPNALPSKPKRNQLSTGEGEGEGEPPPSK